MVNDIVLKIFNKSAIKLLQSSMCTELCWEKCIGRCRYKSAFSINSLGLEMQIGVVYLCQLHRTSWRRSTTRHYVIHEVYAVVSVICQEKNLHITESHRNNTVHLLQNEFNNQSIVCPWDRDYGFSLWDVLFHFSHCRIAVNIVLLWTA